MCSQDREAACWRLGNGQGLVHILVQHCAWPMLEAKSMLGCLNVCVPLLGHECLLRIHMVLGVAMMESGGPLGGRA